jgi:hypothetical protein
MLSICNSLKVIALQVVGSVAEVDSTDGPHARRETYPDKQQVRMDNDLHLL